MYTFRYRWHWTAYGWQLIGQWDYVPVYTVAVVRYYW